MGSGTAPPAVGVVVDWPVGADRPGFRWPEHSYAHLAPLAARGGIALLIFELGAVDWHSKTALAWTYSSRLDRWLRRALPLPGAVYNRISRRRVESSPAGRKALAKLARETLLFNPRFIDKAEVHHALAASPASRFLPAGRVTTGPREAAEAIDALGTAYIKPVSGSLGAGIMRASRRGREYRIAYNPRAGSHVAPAPRRASLTRVELLAELARVYGNERLLVQEAVGTARLGGRRVDIRALVQKDAAGVWRLTGAAGRMAAPGAVTTHTVHGGVPVPYERLAAEAQGPVPSLELIEVAVAEAARAMEAATGLAFFEFSLDLGVTPQGLPAILEMNAKPFPFDEPEIKALAAKRLLVYALAGSGGRVAPEPGTASRHGQ